MSINPRDELIRHGSIVAACRVHGLELEPIFTAVLQEITMEAPESVQVAPELVLQWARMNQSYQTALDMGDAKTMSKIAKDMATLIKALH